MNLAQLKCFKIKKQGMHNVYQTPIGIVWIGSCTIPNVYTNTGYYLESSKIVPNDLSVIAFKSPLQALKALLK
jgi:hypothetical protein